MKQNKLTIQINRPASEVFLFTINPKNTPLWINSLILEKTDQWPVKIGTTYANQDKSGRWSEYIMTDYKEDELFELSSKDNNYHVIYSYRKINEEFSEMEYFEWVDKGKLKEPFTKDVLEGLKILLES